MSLWRRKRQHRTKQIDQEPQQRAGLRTGVPAESWSEDRGPSRELVRGQGPQKRAGLRTGASGASS